MKNQIIRIKVTQKHINALLEGRVKFPDFVKNGLIEYLDVNEENSALIGTRIDTNFSYFI